METTADSDLSDTSRSIHIVTTATLPWLTGTAVNPLLRSLYFQKSRTESAKVTLVIPWVVKNNERKEVYPNHIFSDGKAGMKEQEAHVRKWAAETAGMVPESKTLRIQFYPASYQNKLGSILTLVDICSLITTPDVDVCILEEPEHLTWFPMPSYSDNLIKPDDFMPISDIGWMAKFTHVVGIIHTNYPEYCRSYGVRGSRRLTAKTLQALSKLVCRRYCNKIIKLSATLPVMADYKECICNTHGVRFDFLRDQKDTNEESVMNSDTETKIYFIGKIIWAKGFNFLLQCEEKYYEEVGEYFPIDIYGGGPDVESIKRSFFGVRGKLGHNEPDSSLTIDGRSSTIDEGDQPSEEGSNKGNTLPEDQDEQHQKDDTLSHLSETMIKAMPFLKDYIEKEEDNAVSSQEKLSTSIKTLKDSLDLVKNYPKLNFQFENIPKTRYEWRKTAIPANFKGPRDHAALKFSQHKIFVNPSITEVLCTTSNEALAMGKFVILPKHPSNEFFYQFPNCLAYKDLKEFVSHVKFALTHEPTPLTNELSHHFTWEAAMDRLIDASVITKEDQKILEESGRLQRDKRKAWIHKESGKMIKGDVLQNVMKCPSVDLKEYELEYEGLEKERESYMLNLAGDGGPKSLMFLSFMIAIVSYFLQR